MPTGPTFTIQDIAKHVENVNNAVRQGAEPQSAFLKYAAEQDMPPGLLRATVQNWNKIRTLNFLSKSANRGEGFTALNADDVVNAYGKTAIKSANVTTGAAFYGDGVGGIAPTKSASVESRPFEPEWKYVPVSQDPPRRKQAARLGELIDEETRLKKAHSEVVGLTFTTVNLLQKIAAEAALLIRRDPSRLLVLEEALWHDSGANKVAAHCDHIAEICAAQGVTVPRAKKARKHLILDTELLTKLSKMLEHDNTIAECFETALKLEDLLPKSAATGTAPNPAPPKPKTEDEPAKLEGVTPKADKGKGGANGMLGSAPEAPQSPLNLGFPESPSTGGILQALVEHSGVIPGSNSRQRAMDSLLEDHARSATLHRLMLTDPVISTADPEEVMDAYESVLSHAPQLARDHHAMRSALREALQYRSMPLSTVKELAGVAKTKADTVKTEGENARNRYSV